MTARSSAELAFAGRLRSLVPHLRVCGCPSWRRCCCVGTAESVAHLVRLLEQGDVWFGSPAAAEAPPVGPLVGPDATPGTPTDHAPAGDPSSPESLQGGAARWLCLACGARRVDAYGCGECERCGSLTAHYALPSDGVR